MTASVLAADIGGTKLAVGWVGSDGQVVAAKRTATPPGGDAETLWGALSGLIDDLIDDVGAPEDLAGVGAGCGGPMTWPAGEVSPLNIPGWRGFPLRERLVRRFPGLPVRIHNDAVCLAVAEHWRGAGRGSANMLGMVVSTGVGGGLILGGRLIDGGTGNAGHIGHVVVEPGGVLCGCGALGCLEAVARGPGLAAWAVARGWSPQDPPEPDGDLSRARAPESGMPETGSPESRDQGNGSLGSGNEQIGSQEIGNEQAGYVGYLEAGTATGRRLAADAAAGDEIALAAMARAGRALGIAIASATNLCDLDLVTIGGGLSQAGPLLFDPLQQALREHTRMEFASRVRVVPAELGQDAGLVGAAALILAAGSYWSAG